MYGNAMDNNVTFGNLFGYGFKTTAVMTLLVIVGTVVFSVLLPEVKERAFQTAREDMVKKGTLTSDEIDKAIDLVRRMYWVFAIGGILLIYAIVGAIGSALGAGITKRRPVNPKNQLNF